MTCGQSTSVLTRRTPNHRLTTWPSPTLRGRTVLRAATCFAGADALGRAATDLNRENSSRVVEVPRTPDGVLRTTVGTARFTPEGVRFTRTSHDTCVPRQRDQRPRWKPFSSSCRETGLWTTLLLLQSRSVSLHLGGATPKRSLHSLSGSASPRPRPDPGS